MVSCWWREDLRLWEPPRRDAALGAAAAGAAGSAARAARNKKDIAWVSTHIQDREKELLKEDSSGVAFFQRNRS